MKIDRRTLLVGAGAGAGLVVAYAVWPRAEPPALRPGRNAFVLGPGVAVAGDGRVTIAIPQAETGQGIWTGLAQLAADELGAAWDRIAVAPALPSAKWSNPLAEEEGWFEALGPLRRWSLDGEAARITAGSTSVRAFAEPMRRLGAAARALLIAEAADRWNVAPAECDTEGGFVRHEGKMLDFGTLAEGASARTLPDAPVLRTAKGKLAGQELPRLDALPKANGSLRFAGDVRLPGMLFASLRTSGGGDVRIEGPAPRGVRFVGGEGWAAAVAEDWWSAETALNGAGVRSFGPSGGGDEAVAAALDRAMREGDAATLHGVGDVESAFAGARPLVADYSASAALHMDLEPPSATARLSADLLEVWAPTQAPELARRAAADAAGMPIGRTLLYAMPVGGQGGRALEADLVPVAVHLARQTGRPVQVAMSRAEQVRSDAVRAPLRARMMARPLPDGRIAAWRMRVAGGDGTAEAMQRLFAGGGDPAGFRPAALPQLPYAVPNIALDAVTATLPIRLGYHRGELFPPLTFFTESFFDELARIGGRDPLSSRMALLAGNPRLARCLVRATALGGWDGGGPGSSMGLAVASLHGSHIALVASAGIAPGGTVSPSRLVAVVDCGQAINPGLARQQVEGGLIAGLAQASATPPSFRHGRVAGPLSTAAPGLSATPEILVEVLPSRAAPGGVNGLGSAVAAAAVGNALAAATGRRLRSLPFRPMS